MPTACLWTLRQQPQDPKRTMRSINNTNPSLNTPLSRERWRMKRTTRTRKMMSQS